VARFATLHIVCTDEPAEGICSLLVAKTWSAVLGRERVVDTGEDGLGGLSPEVSPEPVHEDLSIAGDVVV
jgi:hypothetical protein